jgi:hypothetical protein
MHSNISARANFHLEYEIERVEASSPGGHHCSRCGAAVPPGHQSDDCGYCGSRLWMTDSEGRRFTYVFSVTGHRRGEPVDQRLPLHEAEEVIARDMELFRTAVATTRKVGTVLSVLMILLLGLAIVLLFFLVRRVQTRMERGWPQGMAEIGGRVASLNQPQPGGSSGAGLARTLLHSADHDQHDERHHPEKDGAPRAELAEHRVVKAQTRFGESTP